MNTVLNSEKTILRDMAKKCAEYAILPVMEERRKLWYAHNRLEGKRPVIVIEIETFENDLLTASRCETPLAKEIERTLMRRIINHELVGDDKVIDAVFPVGNGARIKEFGIEIETKKAEDSSGRMLGYEKVHPIKEIEADLAKLKPSLFYNDKKRSEEYRSLVEDIFGDILPVKMANASLCWHILPSSKAVTLMGLEALMLAMMDSPEHVRKLFDYLKNDILAYVRWQEDQGLLAANNANDFVGGGSYGFSDELPGDSFKKTGRFTSLDTWGHINSQESVGLSPDMYGEFIFPVYKALASHFGLIYYGCCEAVHHIFDKYLRQIPNLRKLSVSRWTDEEQIGAMLSGSRVIYSRKPDPVFLSSDRFDPEGFRAHVKKTLNAASGYKLEFIYRDVYMLKGDPRKPGEAVKIIREEIEDLQY